MVVVCRNFQFYLWFT